MFFQKISIKSLLIVFFYLIASLFFSIEDGYQIAASLLMAVSLFLGLFFIYDAENGLFSIKNVFFFLLFVLGFYVRYLYTCIDDSILGTFLVTKSITPSSLTTFKTCVVFFAFSVFYIIGLNIPKIKNNHKFNIEPNCIGNAVQIIYMVLLVVWFVYKINNIRLAVSSDYGMFDNIVTVIGTFEQFIAYMYLIFYFQTKKTKNIVMASLYLFPKVLISVLSLYKGTLIQELLAIFIVKNHYEKIAQLRYISILVMAFLVIFPLITMMRSNEITNDQQEISLESVSAFMGKNNPVKYISDRFAYYDEAYYVITKDAEFLEEFRLDNGNYVSKLFSSIIPRVLWEDKPVVSSGPSVTYKLCLLPSYIYTNLSVGLIGEAIAFSGYMLVIFFAFFIGFVQKRIDLLLKNDGSTLSVLFYILIGKALISFTEGDLVAKTISLGTVFVMAIIVSKISYLKIQ